MGHQNYKRSKLKLHTVAHLKALNIGIESIYLTIILSNITVLKSTYFAKQWFHMNVAVHAKIHANMHNFR